jgi:hypothetical protein
MKIPSMFYGRYADVKKRSLRMVTAIRKGATLQEVVGPDEIDLSQTPSDELIILEGPSVLVGGTNHFHIYVPLTRLYFDFNGKDKIVPEEKREAIFEQAIKLDWAVLSLIAGMNCNWYAESPERCERVLKEIDRLSNDLTSVGEKFSFGLSSGSSLWETPNGAMYCLAILGIEDETIKNATKSNKLLELIKQTVKTL